MTEKPDSGVAVREAFLRQFNAGRELRRLAVPELAQFIPAGVAPEVFYYDTLSAGERVELQKHVDQDGAAFTPDGIITAFILRVRDSNGVPLWGLRDRRTIAENIDGALLERVVLQIGPFGRPASEESEPGK